MRLERASAEAVRYACKTFHYAKSVPATQYSYSVFNNENEWCGVIVFSPGATPNIGSPYGMKQGQILELVRVALNGKQEHTSECVAAALKALHRDNPILQMVVSFADIDQNHFGTIYQATNWIYLGVRNTGKRTAYIINGKKTHPRTIGSLRGGVQSLKWVQENLDKNAKEFITKGKHCYIYCFEKHLRKEWKKKALPYPKAGDVIEQSKDGKTADADRSTSV